MGHPYLYHKYCIGCEIDIWNDPFEKHHLDPDNERCNACYQEELDQDAAYMLKVLLDIPDKKPDA